jgi:hypothetical protein
MATRAWHKLIGWRMAMPFPDLCYVKEEDRDNYFGFWVCGIGAIGVKFPKATTRDLTEAEADKLSRASFRLGDRRWAYRKEELLNRVAGAGVVVKSEPS